MRFLLGTGATLLLITPLFFLPAGSAGGSAPPGAGSPAFPGDGGDAGGEVCATGCSALPKTDSSLTPAEFRRLVDAFATQPMSGASPALEELCFRAADARPLLATLDAGSLDSERTAFLRRELSRTHAWLDVRIVDEDGVERMRLGRKRIPIGIKQHVFPESTTDLQPPEVSGTVQRVGLEHLWARL